MAYNQAFSAYKQTGVKTATQGKLIIMLYDEAVRQLGTAVSLIDHDKKINPAHIEKLNSAVLKTQEIITELIVSLDMTSGGEIAKNLLALYMYFNRELLEANISRNRDKISAIRTMMEELRSAWVEADSRTATRVPEMQHAVSIQG